jgi:flagellar FliL protein
VIIIIAVVVLGAGVGAYFLFFSNKEKKEPEIVLYTYAIEDSFITNVKDSQKLLKTSIILVVNKEKMDEFLGMNIYSIRDTILIILRNLTDKEIASMDIQERLRDEIPSALNKVLKIDSVVSVYFSDFVMQ